MLPELYDSKIVCIRPGVYFVVDTVQGCLTDTLQKVRLTGQVSTGGVAAYVKNDVAAVYCMHVKGYLLIDQTDLDQMLFPDTPEGLKMATEALNSCASD